MAYKARKSGVKSGERVSPFARQQNLSAFDDGATVSDYTNATIMMLADIVNGAKVTELKKTISIYNDRARDAASGQSDIFSAELKTKEDILKEVNELLNYGTEEAKESALSRADASRRASSESVGAESVEQDGTAGVSREGSADVEDSVQAALAAAEQETNTEPTEAQKEAGNYKKGHVKIDGYNITIENPKGSERSGQDKDGKKWSITMNNTYGYILGTEGVDGDHIDVFLSDNPSEGNVYVVDQVNADGSFDEHKVMYGFPDIESARKAYLSNYEEGWQGLGNITGVSKEEFKKWVDSSHRKTKPFAEYSSVKPLGDMQVKESRETALRDGLIDKLRSAGIEVITDEEEAQRVLDAANGEVTLQKRLSDLQKAERFIVEGLKSNRRNGHFLIELPSKVKRMVRNAMGRDFDSHVITIGGIRHGLKNHGVSGDKLSLRSIPIREEDAALIPYIMTAPDYVRKGSTLNNRDSVRFYKTLENGYVVVVEKEWANSATDLETINIWGELSDAVNVRKDPEQNVRNATIGRSDAAKIRKDAETAIKNDEKISLHKVFHGSGNDFERFDHSHMGEGEGAQAYGWGTSGLPISLQTKTRLL